MPSHLDTKKLSQNVSIFFLKNLIFEFCIIIRVQFFIALLAGMYGGMSGPEEACPEGMSNSRHVKFEACEICQDLKILKTRGKNLMFNI